MKKLLVALAMLLLFVPAGALAAQFKSGENVAVNQSETPKNLYIAGTKVSIDGTTSGDLAVGGRTIDVNGAVEDDLFGAGNVVSVRGNIGKNARLAGGDVSIYSNIGSDLAVAGGNITIADKSTITGDLMLASSVADLAGTVRGNVYLVGDKVTISGTILGNVTAKNVTNLKIDDNAKINGKLTYYSPNQADISGSASVGSIDYHKITGQNQRNYTGFMRPNPGVILYGFAAIFIALLVIIYLFPGWTKRFAENAFNKSLAKVGYGFLSLIIVPPILLAAVIMTLGLLGPLAGLFGIAYIFALILSAILASLLIGVAVLKLSAKSYNYEIDWKVALVGALIMSVLGLIPVIGKAAYFIFFIWALGELTHQVLTVKRS